MPQGAECVPQKGPSALAVECMHAWPVHGNGVTKGAAHVLGGPANMSMKVILGLCRWGQHDRQERSDWGENQGTPGTRGPNVNPSASDAHDHLAYRRAREHVLDGVGHALEAVEGALAVDERDELAWLGRGLGLGLGLRRGSVRVRRRGARRAHAARARAACSRRPRRSPSATRCRRWSACRA